LELKGKEAELLQNLAGDRLHLLETDPPDRWMPSDNRVPIRAGKILGMLGRKGGGRKSALHIVAPNLDSPLHKRKNDELMEAMEEKTKMIEEFRIHERDTGSADVQIALLTQRINHLTEHLQKNLKDHSSRRGLLIMVSQRRRLLDYLHETDANRYQALTRKLKLRK